MCPRLDVQPAQRDADSKNKFELVWTAKSDKSIQTSCCCSESANSRLTDSQCFLSIIWSIQTQSRTNRLWIISQLQSLWALVCQDGPTYYSLEITNAILLVSRTFQKTRTKNSPFKNSAASVTEGWASFLFHSSRTCPDSSGSTWTFLEKAHRLHLIAVGDTTKSPSNDYKHSCVDIIERGERSIAFNEN